MRTEETAEIGELQSWLEIITDEPGIDYRTALVLITDENRSLYVNKGACGIAVAGKPWLYFLFPPPAHQKEAKKPKAEENVFKEGEENEDDDRQQQHR